MLSAPPRPLHASYVDMIVHEYTAQREKPRGSPLHAHNYICVRGRAGEGETPSDQRSAQDSDSSFLSALYIGRVHFESCVELSWKKALGPKVRGLKVLAQIGNQSPKYGSVPIAKQLHALVMYQNFVSNAARRRSSASIRNATNYFSAAKLNSVTNAIHLKYMYMYVHIMFVRSP
jgi:hypothetical protein